MVKSCVFFAVRTELLNIIWRSFGFKGLKGCAISGLAYKYWANMITGPLQWIFLDWIKSSGQNWRLDILGWNKHPITAVTCRWEKCQLPTCRGDAWSASHTSQTIATNTIYWCVLKLNTATYFQRITGFIICSITDDKCRSSVQPIVCNGTGCEHRRATVYF
jgi:hypothetical protein